MKGWAVMGIDPNGDYVPFFNHRLHGSPLVGPWVSGLYKTKPHGNKQKGCNSPPGHFTPCA